jgi:hypothetical protein
MSSVSLPTPQLTEVLRQIGIINPETIPTRQAAAYLSQIRNVPTAPSSLEVYRCQSRGPRYKKIGSRVFYTAAWLDEWAKGVEVKIYDPFRS